MKIGHAMGSVTEIIQIKMEDKNSQGVAMPQCHLSIECPDVGGSLIGDDFEQIHWWTTVEAERMLFTKVGTSPTYTPCSLRVFRIRTKY